MDKRRIYLDNAATSFPKAPGVAEAVAGYLLHNGCNVNRSSYESAAEAEDLLLDTRHLLCRLFDFDTPSHVIFTPGITHSLNVILKGLLRPGDHCIVSSFEHNAVLRPLHNMGVDWSMVPLLPDGSFLHPEVLFRPNTRLVVMTHASNVFGNVLPLEQMGALCRERGVYFVVDCAQTAGHLPVSWKNLGADALCFAGHKGLLGPQGIGGMLLSKRLAQELPPLIEGGTGSASHLLDTPCFLPDKFEAGTLNIPGIFGLHQALEFLLETGVETIAKKEQALYSRFWEGLKNLQTVRGIHAPGRGQTSVVSVIVPGMDLAEAAWKLETEHGIQTRCGLHCAPLAHQTMGTFPEGTIRFSMGYHTTDWEVDTALEALSQLGGF